MSFVFGQRNSLPYLNDSAQFEKLDQAISYYKRRNDSYSLARIYEMKAIELEENSTRGSSQYFEKALTFYTKLNRQEKILELHEKLANFYYDISDYRQALTHAYATLEFYESGTDTMKLAQVYSLIGSLYDDLNEPDQSFEFQHKALQLAVQMDSQRGIAALANNLSGLYTDLDSISLAFQYLRQAEKINTEMDNQYWLSINYTQYADLYQKLGMYDSVRYFQELSNEYIRAFGSAQDSIAMFRKTGIYYFHVDSVNKAKEYFNQGILLSRRIGSLKSEANFNHWLSELYTSNGEHELALIHLEIRHDLLDSLNQLSNNQTLEEYKVLYEVNLIESELNASMIEKELIQSESARNHQRFLGFLIVSLFLLAGGIFIFFLYRKQAKTNAHLLKLNLAAKDTEPKKSDKYVGSNLSEGKKNDILKSIVSLMVDDQIFTDHELKLEAVAERLNVSRNYLSQVINETYDLSFSQYINSYRINLAKKYFVSPEYDKYSIQGIAEMVGFKSLSAFNSAFKKITGLTPSYYRKNGRNAGD